MARHLGDSARASLITRGLSEITRLGCVLGAHMETFLGLSGMGDLILTCTSLLSRNNAYGFKLGTTNLQENQATSSSSRCLAEGVYTAKAAVQLARSRDIDLPITEAIYRLLYEGSFIDDEIHALLSRPLKIEF